VYLARPELPDLKPVSRLSDCFPCPRTLLEPLEFRVVPAGDQLDVIVPSFRATKDVTIEADVIEEIARFIGYDSIEPVPPEVTVRYAEPARITQLEKRTLSLMCGGLGYAEIHRHVWFETDWLKKIGFEPGATVTLRNPPAVGSERLRNTLVPGLLAAVDLNRHHADAFELLEIGSAFFAGDRPEQDRERRHLALTVVAPGRKPVHEDRVLRRLKTDLETWACQVLELPLRYVAADPRDPWEHEIKTASVRVCDRLVGRLTVVPPPAKRRIDEHLAAWAIALAEIDLDALVDLERQPRKLRPVPVYPQIHLDFSVLADARRRYEDIHRALADYDHELLRRLWFLDSFEGGSVPAGKRSLTFRVRIGHPARTLTENDIQAFREDFLAFLQRLQLTLRT